MKFTNLENFLDNHDRMLTDCTKEEREKVLANDLALYTLRSLAGGNSFFAMPEDYKIAFG